MSFTAMMEKPRRMTHVAITFDVMEKVSENGTNMGSLKRALLALKFSSLIIISMSSYAMNMGWERILSFSFSFFWRGGGNVVISNFIHVQLQSNVLKSCIIAFGTGNGFVYVRYAIKKSDLR